MSELDNVGLQMGIAFGNYVEAYWNIVKYSISPIWHICTIILIILLLKEGNKYRKLFSYYFLINYIFLFFAFGIGMTIYLFIHVGIIPVLMFIMCPVMLFVIIIFWIQEIRNPRLNLDIQASSAWRKSIALFFILWGFWYPPFNYETLSFNFNVNDFLFGLYGVMPCSTGLVVLSILTLNHPEGNKQLYKIQMMYAIIFGIASSAFGWYTDVFYFILGFYSLFLFLYYKRKENIDN